MIILKHTSVKSFVDVTSSYIIDDTVDNRVTTVQITFLHSLPEMLDLNVGDWALFFDVYNYANDNVLVQISVLVVRFQCSYVVCESFSSAE